MSKIAYIVLFTFCLTHIYGQNVHTGESFILENPVPSNQTHVYNAGKFVSMQEGFNTNPVQGNYFQAKTDPLMVFPPVQGEFGGPDPGDIGVVGAIPGELKVSSSGGAIYTIRLDLPAGINGVTPGLALVYNSQSGNGNMGLGWSLQGLSSISRAPSDMYHDNLIDCIDFEQDDQLSLDGNRLIITGSGNNPTQYRNEIENFSKIEGFNNSNFFPSYFVVHDKSGTTREYGNTPDSRIEAQGKQDIIYWLLNRTTDKNNNEIIYLYHEDNPQGLFYIDEIIYADISVGDHYSIKFNYSDGREDENRMYHRDKIASAGPVQKLKVLLESIEIKFGNTLFRKYSFTYSYDFYNKLTEINLEGQNGAKYNPTRLLWGSNGNIINTFTTSFNEDKDYFFGDYNGDGKTDYVLFPKIVNSSNNNWEMYLSNGIGGFNLANSGQIAQNFQYPPNVKITYGGQSYDFNGDGHGDIFWAERFWEGGIEKLKYRFFWTQPQYNYFNESTEFTYSQYTDRPIYPIGLEYEIHIGDFTGDGSQDVLFYITDDQFQHNFCTLYQFNTLGNTILHSQNIDFGENVHVIDFDGDGKKDIIGFHESGCEVFSFEDNSFHLPIAGLGYPTGNHDYVYFGDFNGDQKSDVLTWEPSWGWELRLNNGHGFWSENFAPVDLPQPGNEQVIKLIDLNNDGKDDILYITPHYVNGGATESYFYAYYFNGNLFSTELFILPNPLINENTIKLGDFSGIGGMQVFFNHEISNGTTKIINFFQNEDSYNIKNFTNGIGYSASLIYGYLSDNSLYNRMEIMPITSLNNEVFCYAGPFKVLKSYSTDNGIGVLNTYEYHYAGMILHKKGKGFLCFNTINHKDLQLNSVTETKSGFNEEFFYPYIDEVTQKFDNKKTFYRKNVYSHYDFGNKRLFLYTNKSLSKYFEVYNGYPNIVRTTRTDYTYYPDDIIYGNISSVKTLTSSFELGLINPDEDFEFKSEEVYDYLSPDLNNWLISRLNNEISVKSIVGTQDTDVSQTDYTYDNLRPWLLKTLTNCKNNQSLYSIRKTINNYDIYGNITKITMEPLNPKYGDEPVLVTEYEYKTSDHYNARFLTRIVEQRDGITYESSAFYDPVSGQKTKDTDITNAETLYYYDNFGRLYKTVKADQTQSVSILRWSSNHPDKPNHAIYHNWAQVSGNSPVTTFFDESGRDIRTVTIGFNGEKIYQDKQYNDAGLIYRIYDPYFSDQAPGNFKQYTYESLIKNRVKQEIFPSYTIEYSYQPNVLKTKNLQTGIEVIKSYNSLGQQTSISDPTGVLEYLYFSSGQVKQVNAGGIISSFEYDEAGHQKILNDPDAGLTSYDYDSYGNLRESTDFAGNVTHYTYDESGRITTKNIIAGSGVGGGNLSVSYNYITDHNLNGFGSLESLIGQNNISYQYQYDEYDRVIREDETMEGQTYSNLYSYDVFGRIKNLTYPTGYTTTTYYNNSGYFGKLKEAGSDKLLYRINSKNQRGQIVSYTLGNGLTTQLGFDNFGMPASIITDNGNIQDLHYSFNPVTANLNWRGDNTGNLSLHEDFSYDENKLNARLTAWGELNQQQYEILYSDNGNINNKTDITQNIPDCYQYNSAKPHAVTDLQSITPDYLNLVSNNDQEIQFNAFHKIHRIIQTDKRLEFVYGPDEARKQMRYYEKINEIWQLKKTFYYILGNYEKEKDEISGIVRSLLYVAGSVIKENISNGEEEFYYIYSDHLGSIQTVTNEDLSLVKHYSFDPWGRRRNPSTWENLTYSEILSDNFLFNRGFTGHEHLDAFGLINMNGRLYDPWTGRFLSPDNYVQSPGYLQNYNRYTYCLNNPLVYVDPDGNNPLLIAAIIIGAAAGGYTGYKIADAKGYDMGNWQTYGYMLGGAAIGGLSGYAGATIAAGGGFMANTMGIMYSSSIYYSGMSAMSGGMIQPSISFGAASYNFRTNEWGYLGKPGNKSYEDLGYGFGALANLQDVVTAFSPGDYQYQYEINKSHGKVGHGNVRQVNPDGSTDVKISVANTNTITTNHGGIRGALEYAWKSNFKKYSGGPEYWLDVPETGWYRIPLRLNSKIVDWMANNLDNNMGLWGISRTRFGLNFGCVSYSARALWTAGVPTIPIINYFGPKVLWFQLAIRQAGIYSSPYLYNGY